MGKSKKRRFERIAGDSLRGGRSCSLQLSFGSLQESSWRKEKKKVFGGEATEVDREEAEIDSVVNL